MFFNIQVKIYILSYKSPSFQNYLKENKEIFFKIRINRKM